MQRVEGIEIQRIADRDHQPAVALRERHDIEAFGQVARHELHDIVCDTDRRDVHEIHLRLRRERTGDVLLGDRALPDERLDERLVGFVVRARAFDLALGDERGL